MHFVLGRRLGKSDKELDMRKILEGGSWRAGREIAYILFFNRLVFYLDVHDFAIRAD